jgi:hypothetical protein
MVFRGKTSQWVGRRGDEFCVGETNAPLLLCIYLIIPMKISRMRFCGIRVRSPFFFFFFWPLLIPFEHGVDTFKWTHGT